MFTTWKPSAEDRKRSVLAFISGMFVQVLLIGAVLLLAVLFPDELPVSDTHFVLTWLAPLMPPEKPVVEPPRKVTRVFVPELKSPETPKLLAPSVADLEVPEIRHTIVPVPDPPPAPPVPQPSPPPKAKEQVVVHTGLFGGAAIAMKAKEQVAVLAGGFGGAAGTVTTKRPAEEVQTGGFGSPQGLPGRAQGGNPGNVPTLGSFQLPEGPGVGNGTGGRRGIQGVVASAGFGNGVAGVGKGKTGESRVVASAGFGSGVAGVGKGRTGESRVDMGGFEKTRQVAQAPAENLHAPPPAEFQPIEILFKPSPVYTEEARRLGIQGEVALSVVFQADGVIRIIAVVSSLGHGLDEAAEQAATLIRFKPAQRAGQPTDFPATLRIEFRLADQSK